MNQINTLKVISEGLLTVEELKEKINMIYSEEEGNDKIIFSTVHKAKGLEADDVYILLPSLMPSDMSTKVWEIEAENNLMYVAWTRAKKNLNFIEEYGNDRLKYIIKRHSDKQELDEIRVQLGNGISGIKVSSHNIEKKPIVSIDKPMETTVGKHEKVKGGKKFGNLLI